MADVELKPCPFCGGDAAIGDGPDGPFVNCVDCLASTNQLVPQGQAQAEAIAAWNTRKDARLTAAHDDAVRELVDALEGVQLMACNHGGECDNNPRAVFDQMHALVSPLIAKHRAPEAFETWAEGLIEGEEK